MAYGRTVRRGGSYNRLADPTWTDSLDTSHSKHRGGRWNPPGSFGVLYLNRDLKVARLQVQHRLRDQPYGVEDLDEWEQHDLIQVEVSPRAWLDCATRPGLRAVGLPATYPLQADGRPVEHQECRPVGQAGFDAGRPGVACSSAAGGAVKTDEELGIFDRGRALGVELGRRLPFAEWFWGDHA